jgi:hypothetical protein
MRVSSLYGPGRWSLGNGIELDKVRSVDREGKEGKESLSLPLLLSYYSTDMAKAAMLLLQFAVRQLIKHLIPDGRTILHQGTTD